MYSIQDPPAEYSAPRSQPPTILVVDDDPCLLDIAELILAGEYGYRVLSASSPELALRLVATAPAHPDLFLLDYLMPGMNGLELYDRLHTQPGCEHIPGIIVSAYLPPSEELERRNLVGLGKPYDLDSFTTLVEDVISTAHKTQHMLL
jgi:CheY-like chemotaxis protein